MEDNRISQVVEANKQALARIINASVAPDGSIVTFGKGQIRQSVFVIASYIIILFSLLFFVFSFQIDWHFAPIWPVFILWCVYIIKTETRHVTVNFGSRIVTIGGKWQKEQTFNWTDYQGYEMSYSVMDIPEEFYIKFHDGGTVKKIKLSNLTPLFKSHDSTDEEAIIAVWKCIIDTMHIEYKPEL